MLPASWKICKFFNAGWYMSPMGGLLEVTPHETFVKFKFEVDIENYF